MKSVSIVIPTYNEKENIQKLIPSIEDTLKKNKIYGEIIIIDDNSPDGTGKLLEKFKGKYRNLKIAHRKSRLGVGSARKLGFSLASKDIIISMEGDNTHDPKYIPGFISGIWEGYDLVLGSRYMKGAKITNWSIKRRIISRLANFIARFFAGTRITDATTGYRAFTKELSNKVDIASSGYPFNMEFATEAYSRGYKIKEIPILFNEREKGHSKMKVGKELVSFILTAFKFAYTYRPIKVFGGIGLLFILIGGAFGIYLAYIKITTGIIGSRIPMMFLALVLIISGIQIFSLGLIASVISKLRKELLK